MLNAPVRRELFFQNIDPCVPKVNLSVVKWLPCDRVTKIYLVPNARMLFGQVTLRHPGPGCGRSVGGPEAKMSHYLQHKDIISF
jgi:hypothetical protein